MCTGVAESDRHPAARQLLERLAGTPIMVEALDLRLGETVLDPACGTGFKISFSFGYHLDNAPTEVF
jgi:hypothetical protein